VGAIAGLSGLGGNRLHADEPLVKQLPHTEKLGWRVGFSAYSFRAVSVFESLEKMAATGLRYTELFSWQKLSPTHSDAKPDPGLSKTLRKDLKNKARDCGVTIIGCYTGLDNPDAAQAFFEFAADMEFEFIVSEPPEGLLDTIEKLTEEYKVDLALHNHPKPSSYWDPKTGWAALKGRTARMGFCCDTGHWCRCGLDPVAMLKIVGPRVKAMHLKDLDQFGVPSAKDVIWGQGKGRIADILAEVKSQGIQRPYFGIEWERTTNEPLETHARSAAFFEQVAKTLTA
jgi:sugar phosphate isomerase/epimerase